MRSATTSGVPPERAIRSTIGRSSGATPPPLAATYFSIESAAPFRICRPLRSIPDMRVWAVNGTNTASLSASSRPRMPYCSFASTTIDRPSGVSSASDDSCAASASSWAVTPGSGTNSVAWRLPNVIVPVLSSSSVWTSPAASTARPDIASTFRWTRRSMPAIPIADSRPPMVVGMRQTRSDTSTNTDCGAFE